MDENIKTYVALSWDMCQEYMEEDWFDEESYYDASKDTYLIPKERYNEGI